MARLRERIFAGFGAFLFLASASALTIFVIMNPGNDSAANTAQTATCDIQPVAAAKEPALPETFKPDGAVASLKATDLSDGTGAVAKDGDCLTMKYYGTLATTGSVFDENYDTEQALQFQLGKSQVITGWDQGIGGMKVGGTRRLEIPAALAYRDQPQGEIPANSDLVFIIKLLKIGK